MIEVTQHHVNGLRGLSFVTGRQNWSQRRSSFVEGASPNVQEQEVFNSIRVQNDPEVSSIFCFLAATRCKDDQNAAAICTSGSPRLEPPNVYMLEPGVDHLCMLDPIGRWYCSEMF